MLLPAAPRFPVSLQTLVRIRWGLTLPRAAIPTSLAFDTTFPRALSLLEARVELHERRAHHYASPAPSLPAILSASTSKLPEPTKLDPSSSATAPLPVLSSACPGWICYAEKTHGDLLPFVSGVKSPQAVAGVLVKGNVVAGRLGLRYVRPSSRLVIAP